jgi:RNA polymerase sigma-70 factor (ECF subfamily)
MDEEGAEGVDGRAGETKRYDGRAFQPTILRDIEGIRQLVKRFSGRSSIDVENLAAAIWLEAWNNAGRPETSFVFATRRFVLQRVIDSIRQQRREERTNEQWLRVPQPESVEHEMELVDLLMQNARLTNAEFEAVSLRYFSGQSVQQVAETLGVPVQTVVKNLATALEEFRRIFRSLK